MARNTIRIPGLQNYIAQLGAGEVRTIVCAAMKYARYEGFSEQQKQQWVIDSLDAQIEWLDEEEYAL